MLATIRYRSRQKLPILLLVFLLCVQSIGYAAHGLSMTFPVQKEAVAEQNMPPCHDMADMQMPYISDHEDSMPTMPCCDDGNCTDADCMMPAGTCFIARAQIFFMPISSDVFISNTHGIHSIKPTPPIRPPIS